MSTSIDLPPLTAHPLKLIFKSQVLYTPPAPPRSLNLAGQTAIITGGNSGMGLECARLLLDHHLSRLILTVRDVQKGDEVAAELRQRKPKSQIEIWTMDMFSYASIQHFVTQSQSLDRIDFVILNAGMAGMSLSISEQTQHERIFQVNYLSTMLLAVLLLPVLKDKSPKGKPGRMTIVSSATAQFCKFDNIDADPLIPSFDDTSNWDGMQSAQDRYGTSKLLGQMFMVKMKDFIASDDVVVNLLEPGFVPTTGLSRDAPAFLRIVVLPIVNLLIGRSVTRAAYTYIDAAILKGRETHGCYLYNCEIAPFAQKIYSEQGKKAIERLWKETLEELKFAGVESILHSMKGVA